jgi:hypothetical protein
VVVGLLFRVGIGVGLTVQRPDIHQGTLTGEGRLEMITLRQIRASAFTLAIALLALHPVAADEMAPKIAGTVTVDGRPLTDGTITFHLDDDEFVGTKIKDGAYRLTRVPAGGWRITVRGDGVPAKYTLEDTSPLRFTIGPGRTTMDVEIVKQ